MALHIAWRYFSGKKSVQAINIISWISVGAVAIATAAMILLFSVFNGLENTIKEMYTSFYPDLKVIPAKGKFFSLSDARIKKLDAIRGIDLISYTIEDMALLSNNAEQKPAIVKGVDNNWFRISGLDSFLLKGTAHWSGKTGFTPVIIGLNIANTLSVDVDNVFSGLNIYYPRTGSGILPDPGSALSRTVARPQGLFHIQEEFDGKYVLVPLSDAQRLFERPGHISAIEIKKTAAASIPDIKKSIETSLGPGFLVESRYEQNKTLYLVLSSEKWAVYAILLMVLLIASFNMIGSLSMLVLEKKKDIAILKSMGAGNATIRMIFLCEGLLLAFVGAIAGMSIGTLICLGQQYFGWVGLPDGFVVHAYPVAFQLPDFVLVLSTALVVGVLAAWYPSRKAALQPVYLREE